MNISRENAEHFQLRVSTEEQLFLWVMTAVFGKTSRAAEPAVVRAVISTGSDHTPGNVTAIARPDIAYSNNAEAQKAAEQAPSTVAPSCRTLKISNPSSCKSHQSTNQDQTK
jgi:hypothetical protein